MLRLILVVICVALVIYPAATSVVKDDNAIIEVAFKNYYQAMNISGNCISISLTPGFYIVAVYIGTLTGCRPVIVPGYVPNGSVIEPVTGYRANVALIVKQGTCSINDPFM